jgi:pimeloyl-ACP methyl ester carboxylesterase
MPASVVLLHGFAGTGRAWDLVVERLDRERYTALAPDLRGHGTARDARPISVAACVEDILAAAPPRFALCGYSMGGRLALHVALAAPERVERLVLCCTTPGGRAAVPMPAVTVRLLEEAPTLAPEVAFKRFIENALGPEPPEGLLDELLRRRLANPPDPAGWQAQAAAGTTFPGVDATIEASTLVLHGTADNVVDVGNADLLAQMIPNARSELFPGAGHLFFWEQPDRFVRIVTEFLQ